MNKPTFPSFRSVLRRARKLTYARSTCICGARIANDSANHQWDCSDILLHIAPHPPHPDSKIHGDPMPWVFWKVPRDEAYVVDESRLRAQWEKARAAILGEGER